MQEKTTWYGMGAPTHTSNKPRLPLSRKAPSMTPDGIHFSLLFLKQKLHLDILVVGGPVVLEVSVFDGSIAHDASALV